VEDEPDMRAPPVHEREKGRREGASGGLARLGEEVKQARPAGPAGRKEKNNGCWAGPCGWKGVEGKKKERVGRAQREKEGEKKCI
jgi:hypothetical protein